MAINAVAVAQMDAEGNLSTSDIAKVYKAPTSGSTPTIGTLALAELSDVSSTAPTAAQVLAWSGTAWVPATQAAGGDVSGVASSVDNEVALFSGTSGKSIKRGTLSAGVVKATAGVLSAAVAGDLPIHTHTAAQLSDVTATATELNYTDGVTSSIQTQLGTKSATNHTHEITAPFAGFATKSYSFTSVTSTATDGAEIAGFDLDVPNGGGVVIAHADAQVNAPTSGGSSIQIGVKIGSQSTDWGMLNQTVGGERPCSATSTRTYTTGASAQRISLRAKVDAGTGAGVNAAHINAFGVASRVPAS
jgi:hypothetical protein